MFLPLFCLDALWLQTYFPLQIRHSGNFHHLQVVPESCLALQLPEQHPVFPWMCLKRMTNSPADIRQLRFDHIFIEGNRQDLPPHICSAERSDKMRLQCSFYGSLFTESQNHRALFCACIRKIPWASLENDLAIFLLWCAAQGHQRKPCIQNTSSY